MIGGALRALLPAGVGLGVQPLGAPAPPLWPGEAEAVRRAVPARQREFTAGRAAARAALRDAGLPAATLPTGPDRAPLWPAGVCGSISHGGTLAAALAARSCDWPSLGLDLEPALPLEEELAGLVRATGDDDGGVLPPALAAKLIFSAKEAAFKAQFPLTGLWLDYTEVALRLAPQGFTLTLGGTPLHGRWTLAEGLFVTVLVIGAAEARALTERKAQLPPV